jgi:hypothetical protein
MTQWREIIEFPGYSVSDTGMVRNDVTGLILRHSPNTRGIATVGLVKSRGVQFKRSVSVLVADAFITAARSIEFDTPIHLDGNKMNCHVNNLAWRPRWFALEYVQQFTKGPNGYSCKIQEIKTEEIFENSWIAAITYGLLEREIVFSIMRQTYVIPTYQRFRLYD